MNREEKDAEAVAFEQAAAESVVKDLAGRATKLVAGVLAATATVLAKGDMTGGVRSKLRSTLTRGLSGLKGVSLVDRFTKIARDGVKLGVKHAGGESTEAVSRRIVQRDKELSALIGGVDGNLLGRLDVALRDARTLPLDNMSDAARVAAGATRVVNGSKADARWAANRALSAGVAAEAQKQDARILWVAERNACLHCLAYSGVAVEPGALFPTGLTFDSHPLKGDPVPYPPLHPNCRCRVDVYKGPDSSKNRSAMDAASVLQREAERSVARGLTDYASVPKALSAAGRLLKAGSQLPPTVIRRARRDVERGKFTDRPSYTKR